MMRIAAICLLFLQAARPLAAADTYPPGVEHAVMAAYQRMEEADRKGDGQLWFALRDRKTLDGMDPALKEAVRKGGHTRPSVRYEATAIRVQDNRAVLIGKVTDPDGGTVQYNTIVFGVEDAAWKISSEQWSDTPFDPFVLSALMPPKDGAFFRAGAPWKPIAYAAVNTQVVKPQNVVWKMQATMDEAFLYVRFEAASPIAAPGSKVSPQIAKTGTTGGPPPPPSMRIKTGADREFIVSVSDLVSTKGTLDGKGKPAASRYSVAYSVFVKNAEGEEIFENTVGEDSTSRLLAVQARSLDVKLPLSGLGIDEPAKAEIWLEESGAVLRVLPYKVAAFRWQ